MVGHDCRVRPPGVWLAGRSSFRIPVGGCAPARRIPAVPFCLRLRQRTSGHHARRNPSQRKLRAPPERSPNIEALRQNLLDQRRHSPGVNPGSRHQSHRSAAHPPALPRLAARRSDCRSRALYRNLLRGALSAVAEVLRLLDDSLDPRSEFWLGHSRPGTLDAADLVAPRRSPPAADQRRARHAVHRGGHPNPFHGPEGAFPLAGRLHHPHAREPRLPLRLVADVQAGSGPSGRIPRLKKGAGGYCRGSLVSRGGVLEGISYWGLPVPLNPATASAVKAFTSTRRFLARAAAVLASSTGLASPSPMT